MPDQARIKWLKAKAENLFRDACADSAADPTPPENDRHGWDFLVEFPQERLPIIAMDSQPSPVKFLCQVKGSDSASDGKVPIEVSNLESLSRNTLPAFVFLVDFSGGQEPKSMYFCHIDQNRIGQTLKRIRELQAKGKFELHKHKMTVSAQIGEQVDLDNIEWLREHIKSKIGRDVANYSSWKAHLIKHIGFGQGHMSMSFSTCQDESVMIDAFLGLRELEVIDLNISSTRFGIDLPIEFAAGAKISIEVPPVGQCWLVVASKQARLRARSSVDIIMPGIPAMSRDQIKFRVILPFAEFIVSKAVNGIKFTIDNDRALTIEEMNFALEFLHICSFADAMISLNHPKGEFATLQVHDTIPPSSSYLRLVDDLDLLRKFLRRAGSDEGFRITLDNLYKQRSEIDWIKVLFSKKKTNLEGKVGVIQPAPQSSADGVFGRPVSFDFDNKCVVCFCEWQAKVSINSKVVQIVASNGSIWGSETAIDDDVSRVVARYEEFEQHLKEDCSGYIVFQRIAVDAS